MFTIVYSRIAGCFEIVFKKLDDTRGAFIKTFHEPLFRQLGIEMQVREEYFTHSVKNVFRGLHFQNPPTAIDKIVFCVSGQVTDYVVDIRKGSPTFGEWISFELDGDNPRAVFVPVGLAHGFHVKSSSAIMQYKVSKIYDGETDAGISYKTFPFAEKIIDPVISARDAGFVSFGDFNSPFLFREAEK
jgi:dTDP-4-dehydrorhamnose 3,5-epimerase